MSTEPRPRPGEPRRPMGRLARWVVAGLLPNQHLRWTREGVYYIIVGLLLLLTGMYQQVNLILLVAGLAAGPVVASFFVSAAMLRRLRGWKRGTAYVFSSHALRIEYIRGEDQRWTAALALILTSDLR